MQIHRCPECGMRLTTNYCDICMRRVPFKGTPAKQTFQHQEGSSAHRREAGHQCLDFEMEKPKVKPAKMVSFPAKKMTGSKNAPKIKVVAIIIAAMSVISSMFGLIEELNEPAPEPEYNYEVFVSMEDIPQITPTELYNDGQIIITADSAGLYYDDYTIALGIHNNSDRDVSVSTQMLSVNGYMMNYGFSTHISAGESRQDLMQLYSYDLESAGITQVAEIAFYLDLYDSETYDSIATTELITLQTDIAEGFVQPVDDAGWEMHIDDNLRVVYQGSELSSYGDCDLHLHLENLSDETVSFSTDGVWINGEEVEGFLWETLRPGTRAVDSIYIYGLEELDITQFSQITEVYIEYVVECYEGDEIVDTVYCSTLFNPNDLPTSD